jgi:DNA-binding NtrC family response regulator
MLRSCSADIIVSDQRMPGMEGTEFLRRTQELCPKSLRILLTGEAKFGDVLAEVSEGVVEVFTQKPWDPSELLEILERASEVIRDIYARALHEKGRSVYQCPTCGKLYVQKQFFTSEWQCFEKAG